ncbi:hypothetical protein [Maribacter sp. ACAM166]|uniref:hypothetical protein n=1 Tax=Maribacter sp. ACAM166 TaxID=2508996 RepID=UPI0010FD0E52|nr:hypothetical protein [Maribacter sp. ACAM166]TLP70532.1 hypothetical protein ES765_21020 [Maribacter sp. ACAM166]
MKESEKLPINNVIINDGLNEYNTEQIYTDKNIYGLAQRTISFKLLQPWNSHLIDKINLEGATLIIKTDSEHKKNEISIQNASPELTNEFYKVV